MPMRRDLVVLFSTKALPNVLIESPIIDQLNYTTWENATRFVGAHPDEHPSSVVPDYG